jgi:hypothetical protein
MYPHCHDFTPKGCGLARLQPHLSLHAADFLTSRSGHNPSTKKCGSISHPCGHQNAPPSSTCYAQFTIVTCCCSFGQHIVCEASQSSSVPFPANCSSEVPSHFRQLQRDFYCPAFGQQPFPADGTACPSWSSEYHTCVDTGVYKGCCWTPSRLGKRMYLAARRKLARFGLRRRPSVHLQNKSPPENPISKLDSDMSSEILPEVGGSDISNLGTDMSSEILPKVADVGGIQRYELHASIYPSRGLFAESSCEKNVPRQLQLPQQPVEMPTQFNADILSRHVPFECQVPSQDTLQPSISAFNTFIPGLSCHQRSASELEGITTEGDFPGGISPLSAGGTSPRGISPGGISPEGIYLKAFAEETRLGRGGDDADQIRTFSDDLEHGPPSEDTAETGDIYNRQASCASNSYTPETSVDLYPENHSGLGILDLQHSGLSDQYNVPFESNSCDCLDGQRPSLNSCLSPAELLAILHSQSEKLGGSKPTDLLENMGSVFEFATEKLLRKLIDFKETGFDDLVRSIYRVKPTLDAGFSALQSLYISQVPDRLNEVMSLLLIVSSIVMMLVEEESKARFVEALFLDAIEWGNAIKCRDEQDAFKLLLPLVWPALTLNPVCSRGHRWSSHVGRSSHPWSSSFEPIATQLEEGRLYKESERGSRLRNGANAQICQWFTECECNRWPYMSAALTWTQISIRKAHYIALVDPFRLPVSRKEYLLALSIRSALTYSSHPRSSHLPTLTIEYARCFYPSLVAVKYPHMNKLNHL